MSAVLHYVACLAVVHLAWPYFYLCGTLVTRWNEREPPAVVGSGSALVEIVVSTACGMALAGFATFLLGVAHLLYPAALLVLVAAPAGAFAYRGDPPWRAAFWRTRAVAWRAAITPPVIAIYACALVAGLGSARPDPGSDATTAYLVYAQFWADVHHLGVDFPLRGAFYAYNWQMLQTWLMMLRLVDAAQTLNWLTWLLSLLGVYGYCVSTSEGPGQRASRLHAAMGLLATAATGGSAIFFAEANRATIDVPMAVFFLACALALAQAIRTRRLGFVAALVVCGGFFAGMKLSLFAFLPVLAVAVVVAAAARGTPRKGIVLALCALAVLSAPWYAKNFIDDGDPVPPLLNLAVRGVDAKWDRADAAAQVATLHNGETGGPAQRAAIPLTILTHGNEIQFKSVGGTLLYLLLWLPPALVIFGLLRRRSIAPHAELYALAGLVAYGICYWIATSFVGRYSLIFFPAFGALVGALAVRVAMRVPPLRWAAAVVLAGCAVPTATDIATARVLWASDEDYVFQYRDEQAWMMSRGALYSEAQYVSDALRRSGQADRTVYRTYVDVDELFYQERGITGVGDVFGPGRFSDFKHAIFDDTVGDWVERYHVGAFVVVNIPTPVFVVPLQRRLADELTALGFHRVDPQPGFRPEFIVYLGPGIR